MIIVAMVSLNILAQYKKISQERKINSLFKRERDKSQLLTTNYGLVTFVLTLLVIPLVPALGTQAQIQSYFLSVAL